MNDDPQTPKSPNEPEAESSLTPRPRGMEGGTAVPSYRGRGLIDALFGDETQDLDFAAVRIHKLDEAVAERAGNLQDVLVDWTDDVCDARDPVEANDILCQGIRELACVVEAMVQTLEERQILDRNVIGDRAHQIDAATPLDLSDSEPVELSGQQGDQADGDQGRAFRPTRNWPG